MIKNVFNWIAPKEITALAQKLIEIPSTPAHGTQAIGKFLYDYLSAHQLYVEKQRVRGEKHWNILCWVPRKEEQVHVLLHGHLDTVPLGGASADAKIADGKLWGRGAADMKAAVAAMISALIAIQRARISLHRSILFTGVAAEEIGGLGTKALLKAGVRAHMAIVGEPSSLKLVVAHKGVEWLEIKIQGKAAHASCPEEGVNSVIYASFLVQQLIQWAKQRSDVIRHPLLGTPTLNVGLIKGGVAPNIVPSECILQIDYRWLPGEDISEVREQVDLLAHSLANKNPNIKITIKPMKQTLHCIPVEISVDHILVTTLQNLLLQLGYPTEPVGVSYTTDASLLTAAGIPAVICGPGDIKQAHTDDEYVLVDQLLDATQLYYNAILALCSLS